MLSSLTGSFDHEVKPTVKPASPSNKPRTQNPIQVAECTPRSAFQVLMSEKRVSPWQDSPSKEFLQRELRNETETQVNLDESGILRVAHRRCFSMDIIGHSISGTIAPEILFEVVGSKGDRYTTVIAKVPRCDCPDVRFRKAQCKHMCFVLSALEVPGNLRYQRAFLPSELREMVARSSSKQFAGMTNLAAAEKRKPVEGKCLICFNDSETNKGTMCCHACSNNVHVDCFEKWEAIMHASKEVVCCFYCEAPWKNDEHENPDLTGEAVVAQGDV